jgi:hypothetical protein
MVVNTAREAPGHQFPMTDQVKVYCTQLRPTKVSHLVVPVTSMAPLLATVKTGVVSLTALDGSTTVMYPKYRLPNNRWTLMVMVAVPPLDPAMVAVPTTDTTGDPVAGVVVILPDVTPPESEYRKPPVMVMAICSPPGLTTTSNGPAVGVPAGLLAFTENTNDVVPVGGVPPSTPVALLMASHDGAPVSNEYVGGGVPVATNVYR